MNFNARRTTDTDRFNGKPIADRFVVEHYTGRIVATCLTWREAIIQRDRLEDQALEAA
jgi:hypothetical protein